MVRLERDKFIFVSPLRSRLKTLDVKIEQLEQKLHVTHHAPPPPAIPTETQQQDPDAAWCPKDKIPNDWQKKKLPWRNREKSPEETQRAASAASTINPIVAMSAAPLKYTVLSPTPASFSPHPRSPPPFQAQAASATPSIASDASSVARRQARFTEVSDLTQKPWKMPKVNPILLKDPYLRAQGLHRNNCQLYSDVAKNRCETMPFHEQPSVNFDFKFV